jgi:exodeoxyribonuclease VII large subunit
VARALARSRIPVMSAVGHQDDWTIADYVADLRASTPTDAAKLLVTAQESLLDGSRMLVQRLMDAIRFFLDEQGRGLDHLRERLRLLHPLHQLEAHAQRVRQCQTRLVQAMRHAVDTEERRLQALVGRLHALSPLAVLARGYSITFTLPDRHVVTDAAKLRVRDELETVLAHGRVVSAVTRLSTDSDSTA